MGKDKDRPCRGGEDCGNEEHLCRIAKRGETGLLQRLAREARFLCSKCGREAHDEKNLCRPSKL